MYTTIVGLELA